MRGYILLLAVVFLLMLYSPFAIATYYIVPGEHVQLCAYLEDEYGAPVAGVPVYFWPTVQAYSGWHNHHEPPDRQRGSVYPDTVTSDSFGIACTTFTSPVFAGYYEIWAEDQFYYAQASAAVQAQYWPGDYGMWDVPPSSWWLLKGGNTSHPYNHFGKLDMVDDLMQLCMAFYYDELNTSGKKAGINDMSLPDGGLFDIGPPYGQFWQSPHSEHRWGENADMPFQYLDPHRQVFYNLALEFNWSVLVHGNHYHLRW